MAVRHDLLAKAGSWYSYNGEKIGQGKEQVRNFFLENPDIAFKVENQIRDLNGLPILVATKAAPAEKKAKEKAIPSLEVEEAPEKEEIQREVAVGE
jgi:recombination protein RecA